MKFAKLSLGLAAVALMAAPVVAQSTLAPAVAPLEGDEAGQAAETVVIAVLGTAAAVAAIVVAADGDNGPLSP